MGVFELTDPPHVERTPDGIPTCVHYFGPTPIGLQGHEPCAHIGEVEIVPGPESQRRVSQKRTSQSQRPNLDKLSDRGKSSSRGTYRRDGGQCPDGWWRHRVEWILFMWAIYASCRLPLH